MKIFITIVIFSFIAGTSFAQRVPSSCDAPDSIKKMYREDAAQLALKYEYQTNSPYFDSVIIPQDFQDRFMNALLAVYNVVGLPEADTVLRIPLPHDYVTPHVLTIHHPFLLTTLLLALDTSVNWENRFVKGLNPTGNNIFDSLIRKYDIAFDTIYNHLQNEWIVNTHHVYNLIVLDSIIRSSINIYAQLESFCCDGDRIEGTLQKDGSVLLNYSLGSISCETGCVIRRFWNFTVFSDCSVKFEGAFTRTPENWAVNFNTDNKNDLILHPNPVLGNLSIETQPNCTIEIIDLQGKVLKRISSIEEKTEADISSLSKGTYFIKATTKSGKISTVKFIKE